MHPVYLRAATLHSAAGDCLDIATRALYTPAKDAPKLTVDYLDETLTVPYFSAPCLNFEAMIDRLVAAAFSEAGLDNPAEIAECALLIGTSCGEVPLHEQRYAEELLSNPQPIAVRQPGHGHAGQHLARRMSIAGPLFTFTTACSAAANALLFAAQLIQAGRVRHALVLGFELRNRVSLFGFNGMLLTAPERCMPFDAQRNGIVLGEGIGAMLLSRDHSANTRLPWRFLGGASRCDSAHPTASSVKGVKDCIEAALKNAQVDAKEIVAVKAHGTGTGSNDEAEVGGMQAAFGAQIPPFTSLKPIFGHTLGACAALETPTFLSGIQQFGVPPTGNFSEPDPALSPSIPVTHTQALKPGPVLLNFFGFGGNNCSLVFAPC